MDEHHLQKELDRAKSAVFLGNNAAFLGSLMCSTNFVWATDITTARLHLNRLGDRDHKVFNYACDIRINNELTAEGYSFEGLEGCWRDTKYPPGMPEEDIYDDLIKNQIQPPPQGGWGQPPTPCNGGQGGSDPNAPPMVPNNGCDMLPADTGSMISAVNNVVRAIHQAKLGGEAGTIPGDVELLITKFLTPVLPWELLLNQFMQDLIQEDYSWRHPNRRFPDMYMPSRYQDEGKLTHLIYYEDVSGSISDADCFRFNSEVKYVKETFQPEKMTLVQFDTRITQEIVFHDDDPFDQIRIVGRGGTSLVPVREHILQHRPTAAIIFSDLECAPMAPLGFDIPILWICIRNGKAQVPFGKLIHIH
jgi:hypothetical protein